MQMKEYLAIISKLIEYRLCKFSNITIRNKFINAFRYLSLLF